MLESERINNLELRVKELERSNKTHFSLIEKGSNNMNNLLLVLIRLVDKLKYGGIF